MIYGVPGIIVKERNTSATIIDDDKTKSDSIADYNSIPNNTETEEGDI